MVGPIFIEKSIEIKGLGKQIGFSTPPYRTVCPPKRTVRQIYALDRYTVRLLERFLEHNSLQVYIYVCVIGPIIIIIFYAAFLFLRFVSLFLS